MKNLYLIAFILLIFLFACSEQDTKSVNKEINSISNHKGNNQLTEMIKTRVVNIEGYTLMYGYINYDEEKFGFENPGFLKVYYNDKLIYSDTFKGQGDVDIESLGRHSLSGEKLIFCLNYGIEACDYTYTTKYYFADKEKIGFIKECYSITGGDQYSSMTYEHILPTDSAGQPNSILIVEGQVFHEKDQADRFDTSYIKFFDNKFEIVKLTDNLNKVK